MVEDSAEVQGDAVKLDRHGRPRNPDGSLRKREEVLIEKWDEWIAAEMATQCISRSIIYEAREHKPAEIERISKEWIKQLHVLGWKPDQIREIKPAIRDCNYSLALMLKLGKIRVAHDDLMYKLMQFKPYTWQAKLLKQIELHPDHWIFGRCGRGSGKSETMAVDHDRWLFLNDKEHTYVGGIVSKSERLAQRIFQRSKWYVVPNPLLSWCVARKTGDEMQLDTGAELITCPSGVRGIHFDRLGLDEVAYQKAEDLESVEPAVRSKRGIIFAISTPNGVGDWFYKKCESKNPNYIVVHEPSTANPNITHADLELIKKEYPEHFFRQEYLAEWVDWSGNAFSPGEIQDMMGMENQVWHEWGNVELDYYGGLDLGQYPDETVLIIGTSKHAKNGDHINLVYYKDWSQIPYSEIVNEIHYQIAPRFHLRGLAVDAMGAGEAVVNMFPTDASYRIEPVKQSLEWIMAAYIDVKHYTECRMLHSPKQPKVFKQMTELILQQLPKQPVKRPIHPEGEHDDTYSALTLLIHTFYPYNAVPEIYCVTQTLKGW